MNAISTPAHFDRHLTNLDRALASLVDFVGETRKSPVVLAGITKAFEYTYELYWTGFQKISAANGLQTGGPRLALIAAYTLGLIEDQEAWLSMMRARNLSSHTYNQEVAEELVGRIETLFLPQFLKARTKLGEVTA